MLVAEYIAKFLELNGVPRVFELAGGMITHLLDAIYRTSTIKIISMRHEQAAAFAAEGSARMSGIPGVALATSGPGAVNLLTGIGSCYFDSVPALFITGQVNRHEMRTNPNIRQSGFQETDIVSMARPVTKGAWLVTEPDEVPGLFEKAFKTAISGRPGPVLIDVPMDVQRSEITNHRIERISPDDSNRVEQALLNRLIFEMGIAQRPLILAGGGIRSAGAIAQFRLFSELVGVPVAHSLMGVDVLPFGNPLRVGLIGTYGNRWANYALGRSDFLLCLGSRLDVRQTGADLGSFEQGKAIWRIDVDPNEINYRFSRCNKVICHLKTFFDAASLLLKSKSSQDLHSWQAEINAVRSKWPDIDEQPHNPEINPNTFIHMVSKIFPDASAFVSDVGQHQMWIAQSVELTQNQRFVTSGGMGAMGFALPASIGAALERPGQPIVCIPGDGGFQCNLQELQTIVHHNLPIKIIVMNNSSLGMVRQFQESYFEGRVQSTVWGYSAPDFVEVAKGYGIPAYKLDRGKNIRAALEWFKSTGPSPVLLEVGLDLETNAYPKTSFGKSFLDMEPNKSL